MTDDQLNAAAAKCMGWEKHPFKPVMGSTAMYWYGDYPTGGEPTIRCDRWLPASNLTQAWEFARAMDSRIGITNRHVIINGSFMEEHDGTPQDAARALTICVLRANGIDIPAQPEADPAKHEKQAGA